MNRLTLILALLFTTSLPILADSGIKVLRTTSDRQIPRPKGAGLVPETEVPRP